MKINTSLVKQLINSQFPQWSCLNITPVKTSGWDNRTFHLGEKLLIRLPSDAHYAPQVQKEQYWLPKLQTHLPTNIPKPVAMGKPSNIYPWHWSIYEWLDGETACIKRINNLKKFSMDLSTFLKALQQCDISGAPAASKENFYRGGSLKVYDTEMKNAIAAVKDKQQADIFTTIWEHALASQWEHAPVWIHGDFAVNNILVKEGSLNAVIDFGQLAVGDPACDLALYWTFFTDESRHIFKKILALDTKTWDRGRAWVLWKTLCSPIPGTDCQTIINTIINDYACTQTTIK